MSTLITLEEATKLLEIIKEKGTAMVSIIQQPLESNIFVKPLAERAYPRLWWERITGPTNEDETDKFVRFIEGKEEDCVE